MSVPPHILAFSFGDEILNEGDTALVICVAAKGDVRIGLTFYHNGKAVIDENGMTVIKSPKTSPLSIESCVLNIRETILVKHRTEHTRLSGTLMVNHFIRKLFYF